MRCWAALFCASLLRSSLRCSALLCAILFWAALLCCVLRCRQDGADFRPGFFSSQAWLASMPSVQACSALVFTSARLTFRHAH